MRFSRAFGQAERLMMTELEAMRRDFVAQHRCDNCNKSRHKQGTGERGPHSRRLEKARNTDREKLRSAGGLASPSQKRSYATAQLRHYTTAPLYYDPVPLRPYTTTPLLPLHHYTAAPLPHCTTISRRHYTNAPVRYYITTP